MCAGAMVLARPDRLVFGAEDPEAGFARSLGDLVRDPRLNQGRLDSCTDPTWCGGDVRKDVPIAPGSRGPLVSARHDEPRPVRSEACFDGAALRGTFSPEQAGAVSPGILR
jgi:hypothetical protein